MHAINKAYTRVVLHASHIDRARMQGLPSNGRNRLVHRSLLRGFYNISLQLTAVTTHIVHVISERRSLNAVGKSSDEKMVVCTAVDCHWKPNHRWNQKST